MHPSAGIRGGGRLQYKPICNSNFMRMETSGDDVEGDFDKTFERRKVLSSPPKARSASPGVINSPGAVSPPGGGLNVRLGGNDRVGRIDGD